MRFAVRRPGIRPAWAPVRVLLDREVPHVPGVRAMVPQHRGKAAFLPRPEEGAYAAIPMTGHPAAAQAAEVGLISWTRNRLARFKCLVGVSFAASLARTASGKLQKQAIRASLSSVAVQ